MGRTIRIGTRGSQLALWQASEASRKLRNAGYQTAIVVVRTTGDQRTDVSLASIGGKGLFVKELEEALDEKRFDLAVHSLKDIPSMIADRYVLAGFLERGDPRDVWLHRGGESPAGAPAGTRVGTSSPRRRAQLLGRYPGLVVKEIRGNVDSRIHKLQVGEFDAIVLAAAGLERLGRINEVTAFFEVTEMVPAAGQGVIALQSRADDDDALTAARAVTHPETARIAGAERQVLEAFGEGLDCHSSIAVHARLNDGAVTIDAFVSDLDGRVTLRASSSGAHEREVADSVAAELRWRGAEELLRGAV